MACTAHSRKIANLFGVGKSVCGIVKQICEVIVRVLLSRYIYVPEVDRKYKKRLMALKVARGFHR